jgi:hypothetical protein
MATDNGVKTNEPKPLPCATCASLPHCQVARSIWLLSMSFKEAGAEVSRITLSCAATSTPTSPDSLAGRDTPAPVVFDQPGHVTPPERAQSPETDGKRSLDVAIKELAGRGYGCRAIANRLAIEGYKISYRTVARHLRRGETW